jgi:hypothetical protein
MTLAALASRIDEDKDVKQEALMQNALSLCLCTAHQLLLHIGIAYVRPITAHTPALLSIRASTILLIFVWSLSLIESLNPLVFHGITAETAPPCRGTPLSPCCNDAGDVDKSVVRNAVC